jgi:hypothetical protein
MYFTSESLTPATDTTKGDYPTTKAIATVANGVVENTDEPVNFTAFVEEQWNRTAEENNAIDTSIAESAAEQGNMPLVDQAVRSIQRRLRLQEENGMQIQANVRAQMQELAERAVENVSSNNLGVLINNSPEEQAGNSEKISKMIAAQAQLERSLEEGMSLGSVLKGLAFEFIPLAVEQGPAFDRVAIKNGVPPDEISRFTGRNKTKSLLQQKFQSLPDEEKAEWANNLLEDFSSGIFTSKWMASLAVAEIVGDEELSWDGFDDWADRLGVAAFFITGLRALGVGAKAVKLGRNMRAVSRQIAAAGGKDALQNAESAKIVARAASAEELRGLGVVLGEATGVTAVVDLTKMISLGAFKMLPETVSTAASDLQKVIMAPANKLIDDLQDTLSSRGFNSQEIADQLAEIKSRYSPAVNRAIHSVDEVKFDGTTFTTKVYYKPEDMPRFLTEASAKAFVKMTDPKGVIGLKVVPDTTNTSFLVAEDVVVNLRKLKAEKEAELVELTKSITKAPTRARKTKTEASEGVGSQTPKRAPVEAPIESELAAPSVLATAKPRYKKSELSFDSDVDKAIYQITDSKGGSKTDPIITPWVKKVTGLDDAGIASAGKALRGYLKTLPEVGEGSIRVRQQTKKVQASASGLTAGEVSAILSDDLIVKLFNNGKLNKIDNITYSDNIEVNYVVEFIKKMAKPLGMDKLPIAVLQLEDVVKLKGKEFAALANLRAQLGTSANAFHIPTRHGSIIVMNRKPKGFATNNAAGIQAYMETFAHEFGHAFEFAFMLKYGDSFKMLHRNWLKAKGKEFPEIAEYMPLEMLVDFRNITSLDAILKPEAISGFIKQYFAGNVDAYRKAEGQLDAWLKSSSEFFAENFAKWAFTDEVATTLLGSTFARLVEGIKAIAEGVQNTLRKFGITTRVGAEASVAKFLNDHVKMVQAGEVQMRTLIPTNAQASKRVGKDAETLVKEIAEIDEQLSAIDAAKTGMKHGYLVERTITESMQYANISKYTPEDINSATRQLIGDFSLETSTEQYSKRLAGVNQGSRYMKLLTEFVRGPLEALSRPERRVLDDLLVLGDKEGKNFTLEELKAHDASPKVVEAYARVRQLRDVMHGIRNAEAATDLTRRGYKKLIPLDVTLDVDGPNLFGKLVGKGHSFRGKYGYNPVDGKNVLINDEFFDKAAKDGKVVYELNEPVLLNGEHHRLLVLDESRVKAEVIRDVIGYRAGEYKRLYTDEYFVKLNATVGVDGASEFISQAHRTAPSRAQAEAYAKAFNEASELFSAGKLDLATADRLMGGFGWNPTKLIEEFNNNKFFGGKMEVVYNRTDSDFLREDISISSQYGYKRGSRIPSVMGEDAANTLNPIDSIASEIRNTAYVASSTEWRTSSIFKWYNTFWDEIAEKQPDNIRNMGAIDAFNWALNNKGAYIGQTKSLQTAEKVQEYLVSQMNMPTAEEMYTLGKLRQFSESFEGVLGDSKPILLTGMALRKTKDYPTFIRTISFNSFFALNPVQFFMQGMNAFNAIALSPLHGLPAAKAAAFYRIALMSDQPAMWETMAQANRLTSLGLGISTEEFVESVRLLRRSGLLDGINSTSMYGAETGQFGIFNGLGRKARTIAAAPFNMGEETSRLVSFDIARREWKEANPGKLWTTDEALTEMLRRADDLTQNMTNANKNNWQTGWKSVPLQFTQYQIKLMAELMTSLGAAFTGKKNSRVFTPRESLQLLVGHLLVFGTAGYWMMPTEWMQEMLTDGGADEQTLLTVQQGVVAGMLSAITDGELQLGLGSRFGTFNYYEEIINGILDPEKTWLEALGGPGGFALLRILGGVGETLQILTTSPMTPETLKIAAVEMASASFSGINNANKAYIASQNFNQVMTKTGTALYRITDAERFALAMGIPPAIQEDYNNLFKSRKSYNDKIKSDAAMVGRRTMMGLTALRNGDVTSYQTHQAVVNAIQNSYIQSSDFVGLQRMRQEMYKTRFGTQYRRMLIDQATKDWTIKDLVINNTAGAQ